MDAHPSIIGWASEAIKIPYSVPEIIGGVKRLRPTYYVPDFFIVYIDKNQREIKEVLEIKPQDETPWYKGNHGRNRKLKESKQFMNFLKWEAAQKYCRARGWIFRIATEKELFAFTRSNK